MIPRCMYISHKDRGIEMAREIRTVTDLPEPKRSEVLADEARRVERLKNPNTLSLPERVARIEKILGID